MARTDNLSRQHAEILAVIGTIKSRLPNAENQAQEIAKLVADLAGKVKAHLAMEDEVLYPELLRHESSNVRAIAEQFTSEMGGIGEAFSRYIKKWCSHTSIEDNPDEFATTTTKMLQSLSIRIQREESRLYCLLR